MFEPNVHEMTHKHYETARRAHCSISFNPEKCAVSECKYFDEICAEFQAGGFETAIPKFEQLFLKSLAAKSRCASPMITGPAGFRHARMEKYRKWERSALVAMYDFVVKVKKPKVKRIELDYQIESKEYTLSHEKWGEVKVKNNTAENRLQLFFDEKPNQEIITNLKKRGFKWSPRFKAWQRQLTFNALRALRILNFFPKAKGI
jgi:hypothetical protein